MITNFPYPLQLIASLLIGWLAGALINYLSDVLPERRKLTQPFCPECNQDRPWLSLLIPSACAKCGKSRSWRTPAVLAISTLVSVIALHLSYFPPLNYPLAVVILTYFGVIAVIDLEHRLILHVCSLAGAVLFLPLGIYINGVPQNSWLLGLKSSLIGGAVGFFSFLFFYVFGMLFSRWRARRLGQDDGEEAFGFGDVNLAGVLGLLVGWPYVIMALTLGILFAGAAGILAMLGLALMRKLNTLNVFMAYGPFLLLGACVVLFFPYWLGF